ncbi:DUF3168 domain-containing protein [Rhizobium leguminosarum]|uniref:DUF3168 domain-containing protein n=1 Tax=Rhizobium TaxID=379 RepID=UPI0013B9BDFB|nr:DUF3168 domain-containing protein [Rhizobium ruizarguesonis]NEJ15511.1 DUF3168 domain-containing protein [Rhizobium ruizarguesonis]NEK29586.1 DUF3168 domain-containing protein [Rhizobium ruizarguesonis]
MVDSAASVIKAAVAALKANAAVTTIVAGRVFSDVPEAATFPYIVLSIQSQPFAANDFSGQSHTLKIQTFSRDKTIGGALLVRAAALTALDRNEQVLTLDIGTLVKCEYTGFSDAFKEDDGRTWQGYAELEVVVV